ncbi:MAG: hypothetical protein ABI333_19280 [bacterium]
MCSVKLIPVFVVGLALGCGGRSMGGDDPQDGGLGAGDAGLIVPDPCEPMEAWTTVPGDCWEDHWVGYAWDGVSCRGIWCECGGADCDRLYASEEQCWDAVVPECSPGPGPVDGCAAQDVWGCPDACVNEVGTFWDGEYCRPIICCCEGPDCAETYATHADCVADRSTCMDEVCTETGGYCAPGDGWGAGCAVGHHPNDVLVGANPGLCGGGACCTPCVEPDFLEIDYMAYSPEQCAMIDWDCFSPGWTNFENECGCGCARVE